MAKRLNWVSRGLWVERSLGPVGRLWQTGTFAIGRLWFMCGLSLKLFKGMVLRMGTFAPGVHWAMSGGHLGLSQLDV